MHLEGLKRILGIRGGLGSVRDSNPMVANSVFSSVQSLLACFEILNTSIRAFAVALYEVPYPNLDPILPPFQPSDHGLISPSEDHLVSHFQEFGPQQESLQALEFQSLGVDQNVALVVNSVQHVSQLVPTHSYPTAFTSLVILTRMCNLLSYLLSIQPILNDSLRYYATLVSESMRLSTLLHVFTPWRGLAPDGSITINHLLHQLISCLKLILSTPGWSPNMVMLWMFCTGAVAADNMPERSWFVGHLVEMIEVMEVGNWQEMKGLVSRVIWHERLNTRTYTKLWGEIEQQRRGIDGL